MNLYEPATPAPQLGDAYIDQQSRRLRYFDGDQWQDAPTTVQEQAVITAARELYMYPKWADAGDVVNLPANLLWKLGDAIDALDEAQR